ncbi:hypothetical protein [Hymenobacter sp. UYCo722]|uniref:hypothetical protein n=1 Tax=Hymenobacter sp. UYCo722 TaxID=3156335 RepID=UPI003398BB06
MHTRVSSFLLTTAGFLVSSCLTCSNVDCLGSDYTVYFSIVSATTGKNLVFGPDKLYRKEKIRFYTLRGSDTIVLDYKAAPPLNSRDSVLQVYFYPKTGVAYMQLNSRDTDTLSISYNTSTTKCCGTNTEITNLRFNDKIDIPGNRGTQKIKK